MGLRQESIAEIAGRVVGLGLGRTTRVAVDGVDRVGKTVVVERRPPIPAGSAGAPSTVRCSARRCSIRSETDAFVESAVEAVPDRAILVFDGIFLHRPELLAYWDYSIFLRTGFEVSIPRLAQRVGGSPDPDAASNRRYVEGQRLYLSECQPAERAGVVIDNQDLAAPFIARG